MKPNGGIGTLAPPDPAGPPGKEFNRHDAGAESIQVILIVRVSDSRTSLGNVLRPRLRGVFRSYT